MNIFILHTPLQLLNSQLIVKQYGLKSAECILCYEGDPPEGLIDLSMWGNKINAEFNGSMLRSKNSINQTHDHLSEFAQHSGVEIFISDIAWPLNNRIFFSRIFRNCSFNIVSDGIASYTSPGISTKQHIRNLLKCAIGTLGLGSRYKPYGGDIMGMTNQRIKAIYSFRSDLLQKLYKAPIYDIATSIIAENKLPETCIFFDQPYRGQATTREWRDIRAKTIEYITKQNFRKLFYKPHPMCEADYFEDFASLRPEFIQSSLPAEMLYEKIPASTIISYTSTALFNIKMLAGVGLRSISLYPDFFETLDGSGGKAKNTLQRVFEDAGVEIVRLVDY